MQTLIHADIFFFVTTIAVVIIAVGTFIALAYVIKILRNVSDVSKKVRDESEEIVNDVHEMRHSIKKEGLRLKFIKSFLVRLFKTRKGRNN